MSRYCSHPQQPPCDNKCPSTTRRSHSHLLSHCGCEKNKKAVPGEEKTLSSSSSSSRPCASGATFVSNTQRQRKRERVRERESSGVHSALSTSTCTRLQHRLLVGSLDDSTIINSALTRAAGCIPAAFSPSVGVRAAESDITLNESIN